MTAVRFSPDDVRALDRALLVMEADRAAAEKWRIVNPDAEEAQEQLEDLRDRMLAEQALVAGVTVLPRHGEGVDLGAVARLERFARRNAS